MYLKLLLSIKHDHFPKLYFYFTSIACISSRLLLWCLNWFSSLTLAVKLASGHLGQQQQSCNKDAEVGQLPPPHPPPPKQ